MFRFLMGRIFARAAIFITLATGTVVQGPLVAQSREMVGAVVHCPDGTTRQIETNTDPAVVEANAMLLQFTCDQPETPQPAAAAPAPQAVPPLPSAPLPSAPLAADGVIHCPDGTTRPGFVHNDEMSGLAVSMACSKPPADSAQTTNVMAEKDRDIAISDARSGRVGLWAAIITAWETGDTLLIASLAGKLAVYAAIIFVIVMLVRRRSS